MFLNFGPSIYGFTPPLLPPVESRAVVPKSLPLVVSVTLKGRVRKSSDKSLDGWVLVQGLFQEPWCASLTRDGNSVFPKGTEFRWVRRDISGQVG